MEKFSEKYLSSKLIEDAFDDYLSLANYFYFSDDNKMIAVYWEAPKGKFSFRLGTYDEIAYIIEGVIELKAKGRVKLLRKGDCYLASKHEKIIYDVKEYVKAFVTIYPVDKKTYQNIKTKIVSSNVV